MPPGAQPTGRVSPQDAEALSAAVRPTEHRGPRLRLRSQPQGQNMAKRKTNEQLDKHDDKLHAHDFDQFHGNLDQSSTDDGAGPSNNTNVGTGNTAAGYDIFVNHDADIELGLKLHLRNGPDIAPNLDGTYDVPSGDQAPNRAKWNFDFSVNTGIEGSTNTLDDFDFRIVIESGDGERGVFNLQHVAPGVTPWLSSNGNGASTTRMAQDQGTSLADRLRFLRIR
jgi:hypothetical protein